MKGELDQASSAEAELKLEEKLYAHAFRHRFITEKLKDYIREHQSIYGDDEIKKMLFSTDMLKTKLKEWTGQTWSNSLDVYIHLAFEELSGFKEIEDRIHLLNARDDCLFELLRIETEFENSKKGHTRFLDEIRRCITSFSQDIS